METSSILIPEIELSYKPSRRLSSLPEVTEPEDAYKLFTASWARDKLEFVEQFKVMLLNNGNRVLGICQLFTGGVRRTTVDIKLVMVTAIKTSTQKMIVAHNHPGGSLLPSDADIILTHKLLRAANILDIDLLDHLILSAEGYYSFLEHGKMNRNEPFLTINE